ncbi:PX domain protein [Aspergillus piperis CBS 112811]|uniref:PX domain protein n=1 Tax=Aspergillus piperis CBS 112811 TaxID=1448313 RepID=A0A8G1R3L8_9EURO|nr:PX domain protein [Aspergillus piperis CBS 112811]RAH57882.1 PX domain protein [Aspergillus piperis CBS 112811]
MDETSNWAEQSQPKKPELAETSNIGLPTSYNEQAATESLDPVRSKGVIESTLQFLSTANSETLLGVFACLVVATLVLFGRLGLLLIGIASGIILHAQWEAVYEDPIHPLSNPRQRRRKELALDITRRLLDWPKSTTLAADAEQDDTGQVFLFGDSSSADLDYSALGPKTADALRSITDAAMKDYVISWSSPILPPETTFHLACRKLLAEFISSLSLHLSRKRSADTFLELLTNSSSLIIVFLNELSAAFESVGSTKPPEEVVLRYIETSPESGLANILANDQQKKKLDIIADDILARFLDPNVYGCLLLRNFMREMFVSVLFESTVSSLSRPEIINGWIIYLFSEGKSEIMTAIDAGVEGAQEQVVTATRELNSVNELPSDTTSNTSPDSDIPGDIIQHEMANVDRATVEAKREAKRLSDMITAHDQQKQSPERALGDYVQEVASDDRIDHREVLPADEIGDGALQRKVSDRDQAKHIENNIDSKLEENNSSSPSLMQSKSPTAPTSLPEPAILHRASITVETEASKVTSKGPLRSKPTSDYLLQVEPVSTRSTGWMVFRKYTDFESLHQTLEAISRLHKLRKFSDDHPVVPSWKGQTTLELAKNLECYLQDALNHESLAESEKMKRFLGKDEHLGSDFSNPYGRTGFPFPSQSALENVGKGVLGVLSNAPRGVSGSGKAMLDGMTGVFGGGSSKKPSPDSVVGDKARPLDPVNHNGSIDQGSQGRLRNSARIGSASPPDGSHRDKTFGRPAPPPEEAFPNQSDTATDYAGFPDSSAQTTDVGSTVASTQLSPSTGRNTSADLPRSPGGTQDNSHANSEGQAPDAGLSEYRSRGNPITHEETRIAVELIFAVINELYTLSSAWNIRRTLLNAAKSYILRPGNPHLETIRELLQVSMIDSHTSDEAIGLYLNKLRENALPTESELENWPPPSTDAEKERLRETARKVFVQRGLPQALTSVMGANASKEVLGRIFDCLQVQNLARGFVYSLFLQALKTAIL